MSFIHNVLHCTGARKYGVSALFKVQQSYGMWEDPGFSASKTSEPPSRGLQ